MSYKLRPRLGSAIATTILSLFSGVSSVGVDKAQAAFLTYNFQAEYGASGFFKFNNSSLTGIGPEQIAVSEGRLDTFLTASNDNYGVKGKDYYDLAGAIVSFYQGGLLGLQAYGNDTAITEIDPGGPNYIKFEGRASWQMANNGPFSLFWGYKEVVISNINGAFLIDRSGGKVDYANVSYTLVDTEPEPVPEPLTAGGTALALASLSWLTTSREVARYI